MGIHADWAKIWKAEGSEYVESDKGVKTVFVDGQILLMKSTIPDTGSSWKDFVDRNFTRRLVALHRKYEHVIISFDNYEQVPLYKSIEQARRVVVKETDTPFVFNVGDNVPNRPPGAKVWAKALLNRTFKTNIITMITTMLARGYDPQLQRKTLIIDFINVVRIDFTSYARKQEVMADMLPMGESDVKFMRYAEKFGDLAVESVDSDVVLIAMLYLQNTNFKHRIFVKRIKSPPIDETVCEKRKRTEGKPPGLEYETLCVNILLRMLHKACIEAVGRELVVAENHLTHILVCVMLLNGSDYSRGLPRVGARALWEMMDIVVPALVATSHMVANSIVLDHENCTDIVFAEIYKTKFNKHVKVPDCSFEVVRGELMSSKLSYAIKNSIPTQTAIACTMQNIAWVMEYWALFNTGPPVCHKGGHGFVVTDGKVRFSDTQNRVNE